MTQEVLTIGEVAQRVGLNTSAIRYYEAIGVLPEPERQTGQRRYTTTATGCNCKSLDICALFVTQGDQQPRQAHDAPPLRVTHSPTA